MLKHFNNGSGDVNSHEVWESTLDGRVPHGFGPTKEAAFTNYIDKVGAETQYMLDWLTKLNYMESDVEIQEVDEKGSLKQRIYELKER